MAKPCFKLWQLSINQRGAPKRVKADTYKYFETRPKAANFAAEKVKKMIARSQAGKKTWTITTSIRKLPTWDDGTPMLGYKVPRCRRRKR